MITSACSRRPLAALFVAMACASCGGGAVRRGGGIGASAEVACRTTSGNGGSSARATTPPSVPLLQQIETFERRFVAHGARYLGVAGSGFIASGANVTQPLEVPSNACVTILAVASSGVSDLDAHVFAPNGQLVAQDVGEDAHPVVQLCASEGRRVYLMLEAFRGQGAYAIATFETDRRSAEAIARMLREAGGAPGTALAGSGNPSDAEGRLAVLRDGIARRGFTVDGDVQRTTFRASGSVRFGVRVSPERCYTFAAFGDDGVRDVNLSVVDPDGTEIARDVRSDRDGVVQLCPAMPATLSVDVRAVGAGEVLFQTFGADAAAMAGANTLWLGERLEWTANATPLAASVEVVQRALRALGYAGGATLPTATHAPGESRDTRVVLEPGRCTAVVAIVGRGLGSPGVRVLAASGDALARGHFGGPASVAVACPASRENATVRVRAEVGSGEVAVSTFTIAPPTWASGVDPALVSEAMSELAAAGLSGWRTDGAPERLRLGARSVRGRDVSLAAASCHRWTVSSGRGWPNVSITLRAASGAVQQEVARDGTAALARCAAAAEALRVEAELDEDASTDVDALWMHFVRSHTTNPDRSNGSAR